MFRNFAFVAIGLIFLGASGASAAEPASNATGAAVVAVEEVTRPIGPADWRLPSLSTGPVTRPKVLPVLYVSFALLQGVDGYTTTIGLRNGATEANPLMRGVAGNAPAFWAVKAASTAGSIWLAERLWKHNKVGAIVTMAVANGVMASVAARNVAVVNSLR